MIDFLRGRIRDAGINSLVVEVGSTENGGIGVRMLCSLPTVSQLGQKTELVKLLTRLVLRENNPPELFGFYSSEERQVFEQLCDVKGVSGRIALNILSIFTPADVVTVIQGQDSAQLQSASGVGRRLAERIGVELRERIHIFGPGDPGLEATAHTSIAKDAIAGLVALGYKDSQARTVVATYIRKNPGSSSAAIVIQNVLKSR
ncbi:MAG: Holliday junction branch migration protein RuvA [Gammaproteobacteria bacterium]|nr:Holliday junction branch migration protein RuvA [Gammaproteobacteria bacterium]